MGGLAQAYAFNHYVSFIKIKDYLGRRVALGTAVYFMSIVALSMAQVPVPTQMGTLPGVLKYLIFL